MSQNQSFSIPNLNFALKTLNEGGLVVYPTDTVYGVAVDATNQVAVSKLLKYRHRPTGKAISVAVASQEAAKELLVPNPLAWRLIKQFLPGPYTIVAKSRGLVDPRLESELGTLGVRVPDHPVVLELTKQFGKPITATTANPSGKARPYSIKTLDKQLSAAQRQLIGYIIDIGELPNVEPSTVIDTTSGVQEIIRTGMGHRHLGRSEQMDSVEALQELARAELAKLAHALPEKPIIITLEGEMGSGKTHFTKGLGKLLGLTTEIVSPSYNLVREYHGQYQGKPTKLYHLDCWRLPQGVTLQEIGFLEMLSPRSIIVVEWPQPLLEAIEALKEKVVVLKLMLEHDEVDQNKRIVHFK